MTAAPDPSPLLAAELSPPRLRAPSVRADQLEQVAGARHVRLLLVQAPAGFGKTTLVAAAATALDWRSVWYRLDARDGAPRALLHSLAHAVRQQVPGFGEHLLKERSAPERTSLEESAAAFAREFQETVHEDLFLVLDGYEAPAERSSLDALFADLLTLLPPTLHLVILSRRRPSFALAKLALDGDFAEISHADLRFDADQVAAVVRWQSSIAPTSATIERLLHLTEGWPAGVVLASNVLRQADPGTAGDALAGREFERELFPYFLEEVYAPQSDELQTFLKASCYLEAMDAELAAAVNGSARAEGLLEQLAASGAFTFVDAADGTYRYRSAVPRLPRGEAAPGRRPRSAQRPAAPDRRGARRARLARRSRKALPRARRASPAARASTRTRPQPPRPVQ